MPVVQPLDFSLWHPDLTALHGNLLRGLCCASRLLSLASSSNTEQELCDHGFALAQAMKPLGDELRPLIQEMHEAHLRSGNRLQADSKFHATSACELAINLMSHIVGLWLLPRVDETSGPVLWDVRMVMSPKSPDIHRVRERLGSVPSFDFDQLRTLVINEIGVAARLRVGPVPDPPNPRAEDCIKSANSKVKGKHINAKLLELMQKNPDSINWSSADLAAHFDCAESTVRGSETWKETLKVHRTAKALETNDKRKHPKRRKNEDSDGNQ